MKCPHCQAEDLKPTMIEEYLPAMGCAKCHGSLVSLLYYRHWAETQKSAAKEAKAHAASATPLLQSAAARGDEANMPQTAATSTPSSSASPAVAPAHTSAAAIETSETTKAVMCPKCSRLMTKYKLTGGVSNRVDVCATCDEAWLDGGEWELLEALQLNLNMPAIFTDAWQRRIRHELTEETRRGILARLVGEDGASRVEDFKDWLGGHEQHKSHVLTYLYKS